MDDIQVRRKKGSEVLVGLLIGSFFSLCIAFVDTYYKNKKEKMCRCPIIYK